MKNLIAAVTVLAVIFSAAGLLSPVQAVDLTQKGSLTVIMEYDGDALPGINVELFLIANAVSSNDAGDTNGNSGNNGIKYTPAVQFANVLKNVNLSANMSAEDNASTAHSLGVYISEQSLSGISLAATDNNGRAAFSDLTAGMYLVRQNTAPNSGNNNKYNMLSFIVPVPYYDSGSSQINITTHPKLEEKKSNNAGKVTIIKNFSQPADMPNDATEFTVILTQSGLTKYSFVLSKANNWRFTNPNIAFGDYDVVEVRIPNGYQYVSMSQSKITVSSINNDTAVTVTNRKTSPPPPLPTTTAGKVETTTKAEETTKKEETTTGKVETTTAAPATTTATPTTTAAPATTVEITTAITIEPTTRARPSTEAEDTSLTPTQSPLIPTEQPSVSPFSFVPILIEDPGHITLDNGWYAEDLGDNLYLVFDEDGVPLGYVKLFNGEAIDTIDIASNLIPLDSPDPEPPAPTRTNPKTGDTILLPLLALLICGGVLVAARKRI